MMEMVSSSSSPSISLGRGRSFFSLLLLGFHVAASSAFSTPIFQETATLQRKAPSKTIGVEIELPDFDEMFRRIQAVSPLARLAVQGGGSGEGGGFAVVDDNSEFPGNFHIYFFAYCIFHNTSMILILLCPIKLHLVLPEGQKWKNLERSKRKIVHQVDRIDNFQNLGPPLLRWRASMKGPCHGLSFADFIMNVEKRQMWDPQIESVCELYPINDLDTANIAMGFGKYGDCEKLGVGYTKTKAHPIGISPREQLTLCGIQKFDDGSAVIWGTELEEWHNHLMPAGERQTRARSHLFSIALVPTGEDSFDAEYSLQLDFGGNLPHWMTAPLVLDSVKSMFGVAQPFFEKDEAGELEKTLREEKIQGEKFEDRNSILFTP